MARNTRNGRPNFEADRIQAWQNTGEEPIELYDALLTMQPGIKKADAKRWLKFGYLMVDGVVNTGVHTPVLPGQWIEFNHTRPFVVFKHPRIDIVYEDDDIIVINKGYGLLSVGTNSTKKEETAYDILKDYVKKVHPSNKLFVVHRLDRHTSGLMMFAKTQEAQEALRHNWNNMVLERLYVAVLEGYLEQDQGYVKSRLAENSRFEVYTTDVEGEGKLAVTHYKVLKRGGGYTLAEFSLDTGRKNQIRVHAKDLGHPIAGDRKYGAKTSPINRLCLHARTLRFAHPITRKDMNFEQPVPLTFISVVRGGHTPRVLADNSTGDTDE